LAIAVVCGRAVFDLLRRFPVAALPPAVERRRIAHPKAQDHVNFNFQSWDYSRELGPAK
jgi:hypothetical protein